MTKEEYLAREAERRVNPPVTWVDYARGPEGPGAFVWWKLQSVYDDPVRATINIV